MQNGKTEDIIYRARFYASMINANNLDKGRSYFELLETYVIFFCKFDLFKKGRPIYVASRHIDDINYNDKEHIIYVNCSYDDTSSPIGKLIHDIRSKIGEEKCYTIFSKKGQQGEKIMSDYWDKVAAEMEKRGVKKGIEQERRLNAKKENDFIVTMLKKGYPVSDISEITNKSKAEILSIKQSNNIV